jgi:predicted NBD/HSP70 family sugar kinase
LVSTWVGIDAGKQTHHAAAVDDSGKVRWSTRVTKDQDTIAELIRRADGLEAAWGSI